MCVKGKEPTNCPAIVWVHDMFSLPVAVVIPYSSVRPNGTVGLREPIRPRLPMPTVTNSVRGWSERLPIGEHTRTPVRYFVDERTDAGSPRKQNVEHPFELILILVQPVLRDFSHCALDHFHGEVLHPVEPGLEGIERADFVVN